jgi:hypothetical protein
MTLDWAGSHLVSCIGPDKEFLGAVIVNGAQSDGEAVRLAHEAFPELRIEEIGVLTKIGRYVAVDADGTITPPRPEPAEPTTPEA